MSSLDNYSILSFQIKMHDGKMIGGSCMCTSLGVSGKFYQGMKGLFCGPQYVFHYIPHWNGERYDTQG